MFIFFLSFALFIQSSGFLKAVRMPGVEAVETTGFAGNPEELDSARSANVQTWRWDLCHRVPALPATAGKTKTPSRVAWGCGGSMIF